MIRAIFAPQAVALLQAQEDKTLEQVSGILQTEEDLEGGIEEWVNMLSTAQTQAFASARADIAGLAPALANMETAVVRTHVKLYENHLKQTAGVYAEIVAPTVVDEVGSTAIAEQLNLSKELERAELVYIIQSKLQRAYISLAPAIVRMAPAHT